MSRTATAIGERMGTPSEPGPDRPPLLTHTETAMGTVFSLTLVPGDLPGPELRPAVAAACATLATAVAVGGDEALTVVGGIGGYAAYLILPDGSERATDGITFVS
jgi:hypothetical protein